MSSSRHRHRLLYTLLVVVILVSISCLHPQVGECTRYLLVEKSRKHVSNDVNFNSSNYTSNDGYYGAWVADNEREVPTGPDPLHNREDQT
ncbi:hypothetical protein RND81_09G226200 [Saponaria officinalis]|uniref:Uncharacterized protein n=1 Tax=Saponaria officinalis TaxID=3572 RepID=A0AAW1IR91_SAPOF